MSEASAEAFVTKCGPVAIDKLSENDYIAIEMPRNQFKIDPIVHLIPKCSSTKQLENILKVKHGQKDATYFNLIVSKFSFS